MNEEAVVVEQVEGNLLIVTINRPAAKNAINLAVAQGLAAAMDRLDSDPALRVAILTGAGGSFSSGMDLKAFVSGEFPIVPGRGFGGLTARPPAKPLLAAVEGYALAGGFELALACDLIIAAQDARFGIPEVKRGLVAAAGGLLRLPRQMPSRLAMELALTGDFLSADRAEALGLINRTVAPGSALAAARELALRIAANGPLAVQASKQIIVQSMDWSSEEMFSRQEALTQPVIASKDAIEGALAFAEKRPPQWCGE